MTPRIAESFIAVIGLCAIGSAQAADFSIDVVQTGINVYEITKKGPHLVPGSPYFLPASLVPDDPYPLTPVQWSLNPQHDFLAVVYAQEPFNDQDNHDVAVVGYEVTATGLVVKWSSIMNMDPEAYAYTTVATGPNYTVFNTAPDPSGPYSVSIINNKGETVAGAGGGPLVAIYVAPNELQYYLCQGSGTGSSVTGYTVEAGAMSGTASYPFPNPVQFFTSRVSGVVTSICD